MKFLIIILSLALVNTGCFFKSKSTSNNDRTPPRDITVQPMTPSAPEVETVDLNSDNTELAQKFITALNEEYGGHYILVKSNAGDNRQFIVTTSYASLRGNTTTDEDGNIIEIQYKDYIPDFNNLSPEEKVKQANFYDNWAFDLSNYTGGDIDSYRLRRLQWVRKKA